MNFKNLFRRHTFFLIVMMMFSFKAIAADTFLIFGDSLSAGYRLPIESAWPQRLADKWKTTYPEINVVNASISGETAFQGKKRLPDLLKQHQPRWVLIELGANDGLQGYPVAQTKEALQNIITQVKDAGATPLFMQIMISPNYGKRYTQSFSAIYPKLAEDNALPLLPFYMEKIADKPEWMQNDSIHPNEDAQPFITQWMDETLSPYLTR
ncbi:multifunctional acyl-CoA thioesterase I/protease I/lysophospholipase L1 [Proteus terrae]|uniref:multifunctional acyl-CoA thioesterase I/protease I/lysophospholipase L1 n=1 Tax=Proteus terrae TaxID=1574161 RepID=UPI0018E87827|nr:multifunctional acyl-CoA thioesterase I/protease I/lysophospholipase L1 [Proteus terrae]MBJ2110205.1 multifunctional acyl-CoA thioesterase I/protease I/lysophospholipase L1 [Proteus terrae]MBJ2134133.1 multifunctional acyl-CoA thioesterase I/protease I/lysophospholipase L1 [Proteus terrae]